MPKQAVLLSIHRTHAERILDGLKTFEIRSTIPKHVRWPYTAYLYETKTSGCGLVIGQFTCRGYIFMEPYAKLNPEYMKKIADGACLTTEELTYALDHADYLCAYSVSDPIRYPSPLPISQLGISKAPQSWCYVENPLFKEEKIC